MMPVRKHISAATDDEVVEIVKMAQPALVSSPQHDTQRTRHHICFAPAEQAYNHGSDRLRPLRTMPFDLETWIGDFDHLSNRVWPHPSYTELLARFLTGDPRFPLPYTIAKDERLQNLRLRCCGESCSPTSQSPFVEYEKPSRLEKLSFELVGDEAGLQKLFAIVHRQDNGEYHFWKADGGYHESYGLSKGNVSVFKSPRSAHSTNIGTLGSPKKGLSVREVALGRQKGVDLDDPDDVPLKLMQKARSLAVGGGLDKQVSSGQDEASSKLHSKKRPLVEPIDSIRKKHQSGTKVCSKTSTTSKTVLKQLVSRPLSKTPVGQSGQTTNKTQKPDRSLMHVNEITKNHAPYVLFSRQSSFKVILSQSTTHDINETDDDITGGIFLLEFDGGVARDDFMARIREMVGGSAGGISSADDNEAAMKKALSSLLHDTYIKYPSAQDDDEVETMALLLEAPLIAGDMARVRELRMELKVYLIAHHG
ncbi:unnamed protein product [Aureobasidium pullulans]|nr:unnamed protein product [Aureobasidium pullulans]